jgi:hypothetical protein
MGCSGVLLGLVGIWLIFDGAGRLDQHPFLNALRSSSSSGDYYTALAEIGVGAALLIFVLVRALNARQRARK